jgi:hypothetical protein
MKKRIDQSLGDRLCIGRLKTKSALQPDEPEMAVIAIKCKRGIELLVPIQ